MRQRGKHILLRDRLVAFFAANPDDSLTIEDIQNKFDVPYQTVRGVTDHMRDVGLLAPARNNKGARLTITIGPELTSMLGIKEKEP